MKIKISPYEYYIIDFPEEIDIQTFQEMLNRLIKLKSFSKDLLITTIKNDNVMTKTVRRPFRDFKSFWADKNLQMNLLQAYENQNKVFLEDFKNRYDNLSNNGITNLIYRMRKKGVLT